MQGELDYRAEIARIETLRLADEPGRSATKTDSVVHFPHVYEEFLGEFALVMGPVEGGPLSHGTEVVDNLSKIVRGEIAQDLFLMVVRQVPGKGVLRSDLHLGSIVVLSGGRVGLVAFGYVGRMDKRDGRAIALLLRAFETQNS